MDVRTRGDALDEAIQTVVDAKLAELHVGGFAKVVSVNEEKQTAVLQPTNKAIVRKPDGTTEWVSLPQIVDSPIQYPSGGGVSMTFALKEGDEVYYSVASRSPDVWFQNGGEQQIVDARMHDLSNAVCFPGFRSNPRALQNVSTDSTQIRTDDGQTVIDIKDGAVALKAQDTEVQAMNDKAIMKKGDLLVQVTSSRVDLGGTGGQAVVTQGGPSSKVFAVI